MTPQDHSLSVVERLTHTFSEWLKHRQELSEMRHLDASEFDRIASDLRLSPADLDELVRQGPHAADELPKLLKAVEIDPAKPYFAWERSHRLGNSVLYLPPCDSIVTAFISLMQQDELMPDWLALRHRVTFALRKWRGLNRIADTRVAMYGPAALTALARRADELRHALPKKSFYAVHSQPKLFFKPRSFSALIADPEVFGFHISPKGRGNQPPIPGSLHAWAAERFGGRP